MIRARRAARLRGRRRAWREVFMTEKKSWGSTVLGWFIVQDEAETGSAPPPPDADAAVIAAAAASQPTPAIFQHDPPPPAEGQVAFDEVFGAAGIDADERERVGKAQQLLTSLPAETPVAVRKQIVEASLTAFGVPIDNIIETGVAEIQALEAYIRKSAGDTQQIVEEMTRRIAQFEEEVAKLRAAIDQRARQQHGVAAACNGRKLEIQKVLEFFGQEAVARVVQASPRLHDPSASS
jgi:cell division protein FtsB